MNNSEYFMSLCALPLSGRPPPSPIGQRERTIRAAGSRQADRAILADCDGSSDGRGLSPCSLMVKIDDLLDWAEGNEMSFFQQGAPIAHRLDHVVGMARE